MRRFLISVMWNLAESFTAAGGYYVGKSAGKVAGEWIERRLSPPPKRRPRKSKKKSTRRKAPRRKTAP